MILALHPIPQHTDLLDLELKTSDEVRDVIRRMSLANPLWGAPRIHGELLKLGIEVSQATVGRYLPRRSKSPSPTWRAFLRNHLAAMAAVHMFVVATATFRLLYAVIVLDHHRRRVVHFEVTQTRPNFGSRDKSPRPFLGPLLRDRDTSYAVGFQNRVRREVYGDDVRRPYVATGVYPQRLRIKRQDVIGRMVSRFAGTLSGWKKTLAGIDPNENEKVKAVRENIVYYERELAQFQELARK